MKAILQKLLTTLICCSLFQIAQAAHIVGGEMTYVCLGNGDYEITLKIYRDCQGGGAGFDGPGDGRLSIYLGDNQTEFAKIILPSPVITPIDPDLGNPCLIVPPNVCVEEGVYIFKLSDQNITLPASNNSYYIIYQRCCRNNSINNILSPNETGATYYTEIKPDAQDLCNDSPTFNEFPPVVLCVNEPFNFDHSASDTDGDLLLYELCSPLVGGGTAGWTSPGNASDFDGTNPDPDKPPPFENVSFIAPNYSPANPLGGNPPGINIDPVTGLITGFPETEGQFVVGICVKEYRNGVLLSTVQRDFQFNVTYCEPTVVADMSGDDLINANLSTYVYHSCGDSTIVFENESYQSQFIDEYLWEFEIGGLNPLSFSQPDVTVTFPGYGIYDGKMIVNPGTECSDTAYVEVNILPPPISVFSFIYDTCIAGPVDFTDMSFTEADSIVSWAWNFGDNQFSNEQHPSHQYINPGNYGVTLTIEDTNGCTATSVQNINWFPVPPLIIIEPSTFDGCPPLNVFFNNLSTPIDNTYEIIWDFGDGGMGEAISPAYTYTEPGVYTIHVGITSPIGCYTENTFEDWILVDSFPTADFIYTPDRVTNFESTVQFFDQSKRALAWEWDFGGGHSTILQNPEFTFPDTGHQVVQLIVTSKENCKDTIQQIIDVIPEIRYFLPNAFTPNGDSVNDTFHPGGYFRGMKNYRFSIWNRWGEMIFETSNPDEAWDGMRKREGGLAPAGVYICIVNFDGPRGKPYEIKGYATLVK